MGGIDEEEWGDDHEAVAVMHLRTPILSAAIAMGLGGITTVHQVALSSLHLDGEIKVGANVMYTCLAAVTGIATLFAMLYVARMDTFAGVDRVERLKEVILERHTISELKLKKGLGKRAAYLGKLHHVVAAGVILTTGIMGVWSLNVMGLTGEFVVILSTPGMACLATYALVTSILSSWLLFRVLVWKPSLEYLRPLCSAFFALSLWSVDYMGKAFALVFGHAEDGLERSAYGWSLEASRAGGAWLMMMMAFGAVLTQYAIALELRLAYCGLQDANLDLQLLAGTGDPEEHHRKSSAIHNNTRKRRSTGGGRKGSARSAPTRAHRRSVAVHAAASCPVSPASRSSTVAPFSPGSPPSSATMNLSMTGSPSVARGDDGGDGDMLAPHLSTRARVMNAVMRMGSMSPRSEVGKVGNKINQPTRTICVQSAAATRNLRTLVYEPSVAEDPDEDRHHSQMSLLPAAGDSPPMSAMPLKARDKPPLDSHHSQKLMLPAAGESPSMSVMPLTARDKPPPDSSARWEVAQPTLEGPSGAVYKPGPLKQIEPTPDSAV
eukprot:g7688.t1